MNERQVRETLNETTDFLNRQQLLKQLWQLGRQREAEATAIAGSERPAASTVSHPASQPTHAAIGMKV